MSTYIESVGQKISAEVKLTNIYEYKDYKFSYYGTTHYIYTMQDAEGNVFVGSIFTDMNSQMKMENLFVIVQCQKKMQENKWQKISQTAKNGNVLEYINIAAFEVGWLNFRKENYEIQMFIL